jgi:hypothetical protein
LGGITLGFCFYKLARQAIVAKTFESAEFFKIGEFFERISADYALEKNRVELCFLGALTEVLRRIIIIFEGNLDDKVSPWNQVLEIQIHAISEIRFLFENILKKIIEY